MPFYEYQTSRDVRPAPATYHIQADIPENHYQISPSAESSDNGLYNQKMPEHPARYYL